MLWRRAKEQELQHVQRSWSVASQQEGSNSSGAERARLQVKALESQLRDLHLRLTRLQADTRCSSCCALPHAYYKAGRMGDGHTLQLYNCSFLACMW